MEHLNTLTFASVFLSWRVGLTTSINFDLTSQPIGIELRGPTQIETSLLSLHLIQAPT